MKRYRSLLGLGLVIAVVVGGWYWIKSRAVPEGVVEVGDNLEISEGVLERFEQMGEVSKTAEKIELRPVAGGSGRGMATREVVNDRLMHTVVADLPELKEGEFYESWLLGEASVSTGRLEERKGGWVMEYVGDKKLMEFDRVVVTIETRDDDKPERQVLEGVFR